MATLQKEAVSTTKVITRIQQQGNNKTLWTDELLDFEFLRSGETLVFFNQCQQIFHQFHMTKYRSSGLVHLFRTLYRRAPCKEELGTLAYSNDNSLSELPRCFKVLSQIFKYSWFTHQ